MARRRRGENVNGWVVLDKPVGMTSTRAVSQVRRLFDARKAGHAGTLDPLASGILPIALGEATKTVSFVQGGTKIYRFTVAWGARTDTDDAQGAVIAESPQRPERDQIEAALSHFTGLIEQRPPRYSALKVDGARAYDLARAGEDFELETRAIEVESLTLAGQPDRDHATFEIACGKGTYVRALARDLGHHLGTEGHVSALRRTRCGPFGEADAISLEKLERLSHIGASQQMLAEALRAVETALDDIPALAVSRTDAARLKQGQAVLLRGRDAPVLNGMVCVLSQGSPVALAEVRRGALCPKRVFNLAG